MLPVAQALERVRQRMAAACVRAGREPTQVRLVAVTKTVPVERVQEAVDAGQLFFGENRVQEALAKIARLGADLRWHFVGHLQKNKVRHAVGAFELIHSVDTLDVAREIATRAGRAGRVQPVLIQVNVSGEASKSGVDPDETVRLVAEVVRLPGLDVRGLMTIPEAVDDPKNARAPFARLRELRDAARKEIGLPLPELSMGMTDDFEVAIEEGATLVRVGRAIFGARP